MAACAPAPPRTIPRVVDGQVEHGPFVPAYAYEWFIQGELAAAKGEHDSSAIAFETTLAAPSEDALVLSKLAVEYERSGESRRADRTLAVAARLHPRSMEVALAEGEIQRSRGADQDAMASYQRARRLSPRSEAPVIAMAKLLDDSGRPLRAQGLLREYVETSAHAHSSQARSLWLDIARRDGDAENLALALSTTRKPDGQEAAERALRRGQPAAAARILARQLGTAEQRKLWVQAMLRSGRADEAAELMSTGDSAAFGGSVAHAQLLIEAAQFAQALKVLDPERDSPDVRYLRGHAHLQMEDYSGAVSLLAEVPEGTAAFASARRDLADGLLALGRPGASAESLDVSAGGTLELRLKKAEAYLASGHLSAALGLFDLQRPAERATVALLYERAGILDKAAAHYSRADAAKLSEPRARALAGAERLAATGRKLGAVAILRRWTRAAPEDFYARIRLIQLLRDLGQTEEARAETLELLPIAHDPLLQSELQSLLESLS